MSAAAGTARDALDVVAGLCGQIQDFASGAAPGTGDAEFQDLEDHLRSLLRQAGQAALRSFLLVRAAREPRLPEVTGADEVARKRAEKGRSRTLGTWFGDVTVPRIAYRQPGAGDLHPADGQLNLPPGKDSWSVQKLTVLHAADVSYDHAAAAAGAATGQRPGKRQAEQMMLAAARDYEEFYQRRRPPPGARPGDVLGLSCDGKGVVVLPGQLRERTARNARGSAPRQEGRLSRGEVRNRKRMAETGAVFDITPAARTPDDILPPPGPPPGPPPRPPKTANKWVTASLARPAAAVAAAIFAEADRRDPGHQRTWIALADGNAHQIDRISAEAAARGITITIICDFIHVIELSTGPDAP